MVNLRVGQVIHLGWNGAKYIHDDSIAHTGVWVEFVAHDWAVLRSEGGTPYFGHFTEEDDALGILEG